MIKKWQKQHFVNLFNQSITDLCIIYLPFLFCKNGRGEVEPVMQLSTMDNFKDCYFFHA